MAYGLQSLLNDFAQVIGGTPPNPTARPYLFSGLQAGDGTGVSGLKACYSAPPETLQDTPCALLLAGPFKAYGLGHPEILVQGEEGNEEDLKLLVFLRRTDPTSQWFSASAFRDSIPAAIRINQMPGTSGNRDSTGYGVIQSSITAGHPGAFTYGNSQYVGWDMTLKVWRVLNATYAV